MTYTAIKVIKNIWLIPNDIFVHNSGVDLLFHRISQCKHGAEIELSDKDLDLYSRINTHPRVIKLGSM